MRNSAKGKTKPDTAYSSKDRLYSLTSTTGKRIQHELKSNSPKQGWAVLRERH